MRLSLIFHYNLSMSNFTPTKEELEVLGFDDHPICDGSERLFIRKDSKMNIEYDTYKKMWRLWYKQIYPQSLEDIKTLIRILTPQ